MMFFLLSKVLARKPERENFHLLNNNLTVNLSMMFLLLSKVLARKPERAIFHLLNNNLTVNLSMMFFYSVESPR